MDQDKAIRRIDCAAEAARLHWITPGAGQAHVYRLKADEAKAITDGNPQPSATPMLMAEATALGVTVDALAATVRAQADKTATALARIEAARQAAKAALKIAFQNGDDADAINENLEQAQTRLAQTHPDHLQTKIG